MQVFDYGVFFEDGHRESFCLEYGPEGSSTERMIADYENDSFIQRFNEETDGEALTALRKLDEIHCFAFILVNPPRELSV